VKRDISSGSPATKPDRSPAALDRLSGQADLPLWGFPDSARKTTTFCRSGMLGPEGRDAYSAWLAGGIAERLSRPRVEEAALQ